VPHNTRFGKGSALRRARMSMKTNRKLHAVAADLVHTGDLPPGNWVAAAR
jgi:hypothetical protein